MNSLRFQASGGLKLNLVQTRTVSSLGTTLVFPFVSSALQLFNALWKCDNLGPIVPRVAVIDFFRCFLA